MSELMVGGPARATPGRQARGSTRVRRRRLLAIAACGLLAACAGTGPSLPPAATPTAPPAPTPTAAPVTPMPIPTLPFSFVLAAEAPADAISVTLTGIGTSPVFLPDEITTPAGTVRIFVKNVPNEYKVPHNLVLGPEYGQVLAETPTLMTNQAGVLTVDGLVPGEYVIWCSVPSTHLSVDHSALGMLGTLTVTP